MPDAEATAQVKEPRKYVVFYETDTGLKCVFTCRMDAAASMELEPTLKAKFDEAEGKRIVFDLEQVDFVGSSFLRLCVMAAKRSHGDFAVLNACSGVRGVFRVAGMDSLLKAP